MAGQDILVFYSDFDDFPTWRSALKAALPDLEVQQASEVIHPSRVRYALVWKPPHDFFSAYSDLRLVINLGAGVDSLVGRPDLPPVPITRLSDPHMARMMAGYVLFAVLRYARDIPHFERAQRASRWAYLHPRSAEEVRVGVLGLGELGRCTALELARQGFDVRGWSRTPKQLEGVHCANGMDQLPAFLVECEILVVMLPLTADTRRLLDADRLALLPAGCSFINVSRGEVVDQEALTAALQRGHIGQATLDVFEREPLPPEHPLWAMDNVLITPHLASVALPKSAAGQIADNITRVRQGQGVLKRVDTTRGY